MSKQKFKNRTLYTKTTVDNILRVYEQCQQPTNWYEDARKFAQNLADLRGVQLSKVCGVIAALSPLKSWDENKILAEMYLQSGRCKHTATMKNKADKILAGSGDPAEIAEILNGNKITSFFLNILYPAGSEAVTIDRHAIAVALGRNAENNEQQLTTGQYEFFVNCYKIAAAKVNVLPSFLQSATWEKWRELKNEAKFADVPF